MGCSELVEALRFWRSAFLDGLDLDAGGIVAVCF